MYNGRRPSIWWSSGVRPQKDACYHNYNVVCVGLYSGLQYDYDYTHADWDESANLGTLRLRTSPVVGEVKTMGMARAPGTAQIG